MRKRALAAAALMLAASMLAACSKPAAPAATTAAPAATTAAATTAAAAETKAAETPAAAAAETTAAAAAEVNWPTKPITVIVPAAAGGDTDLNTRVFCKYFQEALGQTVVVSNIKGTSAALTEFKGQKADGYTAMAWHPGAFTATKLGTIKEDVLADEALANAFAVDLQTAWLVSKNAPYKDLAGLIEASKQKPIGFATEVGSISHLTQLYFMQLVPGTQFQVVDAGGAAEKITALLGGQLDLMYNQMGLVKDYLANGDFVALGVAADERSKFWPDVPTFKEQGIDMSFDKPYFLFFPKDTDPAIVKKAQEVIEQVAQNPAYVEELGSSLQTVPYTGNAEEGAAYLRGIEDLYWNILDNATK